jgi:hypothetical protein
MPRKLLLKNHASHNQSSESKVRQINESKDLLCLSPKHIPYYTHNTWPYVRQCGEKSTLGSLHQDLLQKAKGLVGPADSYGAIWNAAAI